MKSSRRSGFEELPHTADWCLHVWAPDLAGLFAEAARGLNVLCGAQPAEGRRQPRALALQAPDAESLLVAFLSELVYAAEHESLVFEDLEVQVESADPANGFSLDARMSAAPLRTLTRAVKAVTYHNLHIRQTEKGCEVEIVFDV
jgi:SHS2 domain-containing protein